MEETTNNNVATENEVVETATEQEAAAETTLFTVKLKVKKPNGDIVSYTLERRVVIVPSVADSVIDEKIGYILINSFTENTDEEVEKILKKYKDSSIDDVIVDLRYNGGGVMDSGINTAKLFMEKDKVIILSIH